jgi:triosephosphate isomerase
MGGNMIFAGNWKLNMGPKESTLFIEKLREELPENKHSQCFFFPQNLSLPASLVAATDSQIKIGVQNIYKENSGAFTGENSLSAAEELGADLCLIGHSERRSLFFESDELLNQKMHLLAESKILPLLCIGEKLEERESGKTNEVLAEQLNIALKNFPESKELYLAYEPVWAIGTGKVASPEMAEDAHQFIREHMASLYSKEKADSTKILYGGSVKAENASDLSKKPNIDGFLIGGASLKLDSYMGIIQASS